MRGRPANALGAQARRDIVAAMMSTCGSDGRQLVLWGCPSAVGKATLGDTAGGERIGAGGGSVQRRLTADRRDGDTRTAAPGGGGLGGDALENMRIAR